jgi:hypothetical protein
VALHPGYPVVEGRYQMTSDWALVLPEPVNQRFEDDALVLWRPGFTAWVIVWGNDQSEDSLSRMRRIKEDTSPEAFDVEVIDTGHCLKYGYRLAEDEDGDLVHAFHGFTIGGSGHVQMAIHFDVEGDLDLARGIWMSVVESV